MKTNRRISIILANSLRKDLTSVCIILRCEELRLVDDTKRTSIGIMASLSGSFSRIFAVVVALNLGISFAFSVVATLSPTPTPTSSRMKDTQVAVDGKSTVAVPSLPCTSTRLPQNISLTSYMRLPVEQYVLIPMPLDSSLTRIYSDNANINSEDERAGNATTAETPFNSTSSSAELFELVVPNITFFQLKLQPVVYATVIPEPNQVTITSEKCVLRGSPFIEKVKLNDRFDFSVTTTLTWHDVNNSSHSHSQPNVTTECSTITAETCIIINVDVPRPFNAIPKRVLEATGSTAVKLTLLYIQANFVGNLVTDYVKWATVAEYRKYRASLSMEGQENNMV